MSAIYVAGWRRGDGIAHYATNPKVSTVAACGQDLDGLDPNVDGLDKCRPCLERLGARPE